VLHSIEVAFEAEPVGVGLLGAQPVSRTARSGRTRRQLVGQACLALLAREQRRADVASAPGCARRTTSSSTSITARSGSLVMIPA
jgi:hypothetical protein